MIRGEKVQWECLHLGKVHVSFNFVVASETSSTDADAPGVVRGVSDAGLHGFGSPTPSSLSAETRQ